jgi:hypothetical protein
MRQIIEACVLAFLFPATVVSAQDAKISVSNEIVVGQFETKFAETGTSWVIYGKSYEPVVDRITVNLSPWPTATSKLKQFDFAVSFNAASAISAPLGVDPLTGVGSDQNLGDYRGSENDLTVGTTYRLPKGFYASLHFMSIGLDESYTFQIQDNLGITGVPVTLKRSYKAFEYGGGYRRHFALDNKLIKSMSVNASYAWMPKIARTDSQGGNLGVSDIDNEASGQDLKLITSVEHGHIGFQTSFRLRRLDTPNGNKAFGIVPFAVPEIATVRQFGFGIVAKF